MSSSSGSLSLSFAPLEGGQSDTLPQKDKSSSFSSDIDCAAAWQATCRFLQKDLGSAAFQSWIHPLRFLSSDDDTLRLAATTRMMRDWVLRHYRDQIQLYWHQATGQRPHIEVTVVSNVPNLTRDADAAAEKAGPVASSKGYFSSAAGSAAGSSMGGEASFAVESLSASLDPRFTFDRFVVGGPNELAFAAAKRVAESREVTFNPLFLYGGVGLGKTHLMHAIAWHIRKHSPERRVVYLSAEKFMYHFIRALRYRDTVAFKEQFRSVDVLMIDDVQFISGKESTQEEFFHTFNALVDENRQIIISADKSPQDLDGMEERLKSRLGWGLVADIHPTTYELRLGILQNKAESLNLDVPQNVLEFIAHKITSNIRELEGALNRLSAHATLVGRAITLETTEDVLQDLLRAARRQLSVEEIQRKTAEHFHVKMADLLAARRSRVIARPRQIAMYLAKQLTPYSLPEIGRKFGGRDHTTILHGIRKVEELMEKDVHLAEDVALLKRMLQN